MRRSACTTIGAILLALSSTIAAADAPPARRIKAIAFDAFPIFDPRPTATVAETLVPGDGKRLVDLWRRRQFEYCWLRALSGRYVDFWTITQDALEYAAQALDLRLTDAARSRLMETHRTMTTWPDVAPVLQKLRHAGYRLVFLSNFSPEMLAAAAKSARVDEFFEMRLSTDPARTYKPDPRAYRLAPDALRLERAEILFVAFAGWDAAGAKAFGFPTFWVNRLLQPAEKLGVQPDGVGTGLEDLARYLGL